MLAELSPISSRPKNIVSLNMDKVFDPKDIASGVLIWAESLSGQGAAVLPILNATHSYFRK